MNKKIGLYIYIGVSIISILAYLGITTYSYIIKQCQNKYGMSYNEKRNDLGIPIIPADWSIKERNEHYIGWSGDEARVGHKRKSVFLSGCNIEGESDVFLLSKQDGKVRILEMEYNYPTESQSAGVIYTYQIGQYANSISKMTADSLLKADNIQWAVQN